MKYLSLFLLSTIGCSSLKYTHQVDYHYTNHSYSSNSVSDSALINNRSLVQLKSDSTLSGVIVGFNEDGLLLKKQAKKETVEIPFKSISSFEASGFNTQFYNRNVFGYGTALTFLFLVVPTIAASDNEKITSKDISVEVVGYLGLSLLGGYFATLITNPDDKERKSGVVKVTVGE